METSVITYKTKTANLNDIKTHLTKCDDSFVPALSKRVNITDYSKKIFENAITFEAWNDTEMIGMIATYFNKENNIGFITSVSVMKDFMGGGIASKLLLNCLEYAKGENYREIKLEVFKDNVPAINFYKKHQFAQYSTIDDSIFMNHLLTN